MTGGIILILVLAVLSISGCTYSFNSEDLLEHRQDKTVHDAAENIELDVSTVNGNIEIRESDEYDVEVTYDIKAPKGHLLDITTGTNGSRDGNTMKIIAEAKPANSTQMLINTGANITVKVPKNSSYNLTLVTPNGNVKVTALNGTNLTMDLENGNIDAAIGNFSIVNGWNSNGNIAIKLHNGTRFYVDAMVGNGRVRHDDIHMAPETDTDRHLKGYTESGNGSLRMDLSTSNGNIDISYI
jgi:DUF4097 and DUF4098 domain-containing protein YvlB